MKLVIFAGGFGRRLWPLSRSHSPKQFEPIIGERSTVQLAVDRVLPHYGAENIFISTNERFVEIIRQQLPHIPTTNIIGEPTRRDLAAAVGLAMGHMAHHSTADEPIAILWGDNYMRDTVAFGRILQTAERLVQRRETAIVFMGESPRFANHNLGWIRLDEPLGQIEEQPYYRFGQLTYRPSRQQCQQMFASGDWVWNTGYFVTQLRYVQQAYQTHQPQMWATLTQIAETLGTSRYRETLGDLYPQLTAMSFDDAILTHLDPRDALVLHAPMGWSDPGTLYALKEAINPDPQANVTRGLVKADFSTDSLIYNDEADKLVLGVGLEGMIVVNTEDALLVVHKDHIPQVKQIVEGFVGTDLEKLS